MDALEPSIYSIDMQEPSSKLLESENKTIKLRPGLKRLIEYRSPSFFIEIMPIILLCPLILGIQIRTQEPYPSLGTACAVVLYNVGTIAILRYPFAQDFIAMMNTTCLHLLGLRIGIQAQEPYLILVAACALAFFGVWVIAILRYALARNIFWSSRSPSIQQSRIYGTAYNAIFNYTTLRLLSSYAKTAKLTTSNALRMIGWSEPLLEDGKSRVRWKCVSSRIPTSFIEQH